VSNFVFSKFKEPSDDGKKEADDISVPGVGITTELQNTSGTVDARFEVIAWNEVMVGMLVCVQIPHKRQFFILALAFILTRYSISS
jgi:hypothetical protein